MKNQRKIKKLDGGCSPTNSNIEHKTWRYHVIRYATINFLNKPWSTFIFLQEP